MTIGIAIPTFVKYKDLLPRLLDNIAEQTVLPDMVSIAMSECIIDEPKGYPFKIVLDCTEDVRNLAQNSNIALSKLDTDILTIMHGDDLMHPQRNELIRRFFISGLPDVVVHGFKYVTDVPSEWDKWDWPEFYPDHIDTLINSCLYPNSTPPVEYLNGHISFRREIFEKFKYNEDPEWFYYSDSEYTRRLVTNGIYLSYIPQPLVYYFKDPTWHR